MTAATLAAALGRCLGRFQEAWGAEFDWRDSHDVQALATLMADELVVVVDREAHRKVMAMIREWGGEDA